MGSNFLLPTAHMRDTRSDMSILSALRLTKAPATAFAVVGLFWGSFAAQVPVIKAGIGASDAVFGMALLGTSVGLLTTMMLAPMIDRSLRSWALPVATGLLAAAFLLPGLATAPPLFFAAMALAGLASGLLDVTMNARVSEVEARSGRSLMNANHGMFSVAYACSALLTGLLRELGWPPLGIFSALGCLALLMATRMFMPVSPVAAAQMTAARFPTGLVLICGGIVLIAFMTEAAVESWSALHVERSLGGGAAEGALGPAMLGLTMAVGRFGGQAVCDRLPDLQVIFWAGLMAMAGAVISAMAPVPWVAYLGFGVLGLGISVIGPLGLAIVGRLVRPEVRTDAIARTAVIGFSGFFLAPALMGLISEGYGLSTAFLAIAVLVAGLFPLLGMLKRRGG